MAGASAGGGGASGGVASAGGGMINASGSGGVSQGGGGSTAGGGAAGTAPIPEGLTVSPLELVFGAVQALAGDACDAGPNGSGNHLFTVTGPGIVKVTLRFDASPDPNVGFDDISFCQRIDATPAVPNSWGMVKTIYR